MVNKNYAIAMTEILHLFKGFSDEELEKIPSKLISFFKENADKSYICDFDYNTDIEELHLKDETYGLISMICYNYWCETPEEKQQYLNILEKNEREYQKYISEKYNTNNLFKNKEINYNKNLPIFKSKQEKWYEKIIKFIKRILYK